MHEAQARCDRVMLAKQPPFFRQQHENQAYEAAAERADGQR